jgi:hypothetical protein
MLFLRQSYASDAGQARNRFVASRRHAASVRRFRTVLARVGQERTGLHPGFTADRDALSVTLARAAPMTHHFGHASAASSAGYFSEATVCRFHNYKNRSLCQLLTRSRDNGAGMAGV